MTALRLRTIQVSGWLTRHIVSRNMKYLLTVMAVSNTDLVLQAWKERWNPLQWLVEVRNKFHGENSDSLKSMADCLIQQATFGVTPSALILSYLKHSVTSKLIPYSAVLNAIQQFQNIGKQRCLTAILNLLLDITPTVSCPDGESECLELAVALVRIVYWLLITVTRLLKLCLETIKVSTNQSVHLLCISKCHRIFSHVIGTHSFRGLVIVGKIEDQGGLTMELERQFQVHLKEFLLLTQSEVAPPELQLHFKEFMNNINRLHNLSSLNGAVDRSPGSTPNMAVQMITQHQVLVEPADTPQHVADIMDVVLQAQNVVRQHLYLEIVRSCLVGLLESSKPMEETLWAGFLFLKLPRVISLLEVKHQAISSLSGEDTAARSAFQQLLGFVRLLDDVDSKYRLNCYQVLLQQYSRIVPPQAGDSIEELMKLRNVSHSVEGAEGLVQTAQPIRQILSSESKVVEVVQAIESNSSNLLILLNSLLNVEKLKFVTVAASSIGKMESLVSGLIRLTEQTIHSAMENEDVKSGNLRCDLFNSAFMILVHISQVYGRKIVLDASEGLGATPFIAQWISLYIPDKDKWRTYYPDPDHVPNEHTVSYLLDQLFSTSTFETCQVQWDSMCWNVSNTMHEVLKAWQFESLRVSTDTLEELCKNLKCSAPALAVCVCAWCCGLLGVLNTDERDKPRLLLQSLLVPLNPRGVAQDFADRCCMMLDIMTRMSQSIQGRDDTWGENCSLIEGEPSTKIFSGLFRRAVKEKALASTTLGQFRHLMVIGGPEWFVGALVKEMLKFSSHEEIRVAADLACCLLLFDTASLIPVLLTEVLPVYLHRASANTTLQDPKGWALAHLASQSLALGLVKQTTRTKLDESDDDGERPAKTRKIDENTSSSSRNQSAIRHALVSLCEEFVSAVRENEIGPVALFLISFLQQAVASSGTVTGPMLSCLPSDLVQEILSLLPRLYSDSDVLLGICNLSSVEGRTVCAAAICNGI